MRVQTTNHCAFVLLAVPAVGTYTKELRIIIRIINNKN